MSPDSRGSGIGAVSYGTSNAGICSIAGTTLTAAGIGTCTITATKAQDAQFNVASDTFNLTVNQAPQTITFNPLSNKLTTDAPFVVAASSASGLTVTFGATGVCTSGGVNGATISLTGVAGACNVTASQIGNVNVLAATPVLQSFTVADSGLEVFPPNCVMPPGWNTVVPGQTNSWTVVNGVGDASQGACALKSSPLPIGAPLSKSQIQIAATFETGNIAFSRRVGSEAFFDCLRV